MNTPRVNLVVLRVADIDRAAAFYRLLGFEFSKHAHGTGPQHYACESNGFVFELYPATPEARFAYLSDDAGEGEVVGGGEWACRL
ncbi:MAG: VOC family protein [Tepidisphaeraceae bacterium]